MLRNVLLCLPALLSLTYAAGPTNADIQFPDLNGKQIRAYLVKPAGTPHGAAWILFVHWLESGSPDSDRSQFLAQAWKLARDGMVSLLPETMWSDPEWFSS